MKLLDVIKIKNLGASKNNTGSEKARHRMGQMYTYACVCVQNFLYWGYIIPNRYINPKINRKKWAKDLNEHFTKEKKMANKHEKFLNISCH